MLTFLGQVCFEFQYTDLRFFIDPYFSNSVEEKEDPTICRLVPIPYKPESLTNVDFVLLTHAHRDHCDIDTLLPMSIASPDCQFFGPAPVVSLLKNAGIDEARIHSVNGRPFQIKGLQITPVPSAHPQVHIDDRGGWQAVGYILEVEGISYYHPGDTAVTSEVISAVRAYGPINIGMLPVNEINFYRNKDNIIGNMSLREAFQFAEDINVEVVIPTHWDMFAVNQVYKEEIQFLYDRTAPNFTLKIMDAGSNYVG